MESHQLRELPLTQHFKTGDMLVLFGELFKRGYANGLIDQAKDAGMEIVGITVGRRDKDTKMLRPLTEEELKLAEENIGGKIINIPLEAGFDMEVIDGDRTIANIVGEMKLDQWEELKIAPEFIEKAQKQGQERFKNDLSKVVVELKKHYPAGKNVLVAHIMAGGVIRAKSMLLIANRVFRSRGDKFIASEKFWQSTIGRISDKNFQEVTANTFNYLLEATADWRKEVEAEGNNFCYCAYGYHGCEILISDSYRWQTYTPYQQGHAKKLLEDYARQAHANGVKATVVNCPEIRTNSSDVFSGVELSLYPFLSALSKETDEEFADKYWQICQEKLKPEFDLKQIIAKLSGYFNSDVLKEFDDFESWPKENNPQLAELMVGTSEQIVRSHKNRKDLITDFLSALIIKATGMLIFRYVGDQQEPVVWLGHQLIAKQLKQMKSEL